MLYIKEDLINEIRDRDIVTRENRVFRLQVVR